MRIWGRRYLPDGTYVWDKTETAPDGSDDMVYVVDLVQVLRLNRNESPFYANWGIPAQQSVIQQVFPDYYVTLTQQQFSAFFASLIVARLAAPDPTYRVSVTTNQGVRLQFNLPTGRAGSS
jgi:hypothetical protein